MNEFCAHFTGCRSNISRTNSIDSERFHHILFQPVMGIITCAINDDCRMAHVHKCRHTIHVGNIHIHIRCQYIVCHTVKGITNGTAKSSLGTNDPDFCFTHIVPPCWPKKTGLVALFHNSLCSSIAYIICSRQDFRQKNLIMSMIYPAHLIHCRILSSHVVKCDF